MREGGRPVWGGYLPGGGSAGCRGSRAAPCRRASPGRAASGASGGRATRAPTRETRRAWPARARSTSSPGTSPRPARAAARAPAAASMVEDSEDVWLSLKPIEPLPSQCCGSGCKPCIFDIYQKELEQWEEAKAKKDRSLLTRKKQQSTNSELTPETFMPFIICSVDQLSEDTYQYTFELPENSRLGLSLGQHVVLRGLVNGLEVQRAYTPISPVNAEGYFEVLIKCYGAGLMSQYIKSWKEGDVVFWRGPFGGFPYVANKYGELFLLASGTGLAPMLPILKYITDNEDDETFVTLVGCFRTFENIYLKSRLQEQSQFWNIRTFYVLSQEHSLENLPWSFREKTHIGRINEDLIKSMMKTCRRQPFVLICGSVTFSEDMEKYLKAIGLGEESYFIF
uniref:NADH-cytochrome b5 reductase-like n=2 Tax=Anolis carolinensis TaxID=28377 RepID=G1KUX9_ANOCA